MTSAVLLLLPSTSPTLTNSHQQLWIDHPAFPVSGHKFTGYYFTYPSEEKHMGLVSTIAEDPPMLNWIYVHKETSLVRHSGRQETIGHTIGPWFWSKDERWLTLQGGSGDFVAIQDEETGNWCVAWDGDGRIRDGVADDDDSEDEGVDWAPVLLHRKMQFGMDSSYVKGANG